MDKKVFQYSFTVILICLLQISHAKSAIWDLEVRKTISKEFPTSASSTLEISNRYGKVEVQTWDKANVKIDVTIIVKASKKSDAQDKLDDISVEMKSSGSFITAMTEIESSNSSWWDGWWKGNDNVSMEINYMVHMPSTLPSIIENKYGNIYLPNLNAKTSITLKYGNLEAKDINNDLMLDLGYGKATIGDIKNINANLSYSDYRGTKLSTGVFTTKYSKVYLDNATSLTAYSKYDDYKMGDIQSFNLTGSYDNIEMASCYNCHFEVKYSGIEIMSVGSTLDMEIKYGSLTIENLKTSFKNIDIQTSYAPIKIHGLVPTKIDLKGKYYDAKLGNDFIQKTREEEGSSLIVKGYKISEKTSAIIRIASSYGDVTIR